MSSSMNPTPKSPKIRVFRDDLDAAQQVLQVRRDQAATLHNTTMSEWKKTCTSKKNHTIMLRMLVAESFRFRYGTRLTADQKKDMKALMTKIDLAMAGGDAYADLVRAFSAMPMFVDSCGKNVDL